ncbi:multicopper oxidase domain-containing protein [Paractinoplanes ferrugineus]|uniref:Multicopper oxidase n=1 Tax=Paractinoplanes ferrugineus TaxID=113564 RepID=A0A919J6X3_9ACTN|nr:multicopper oxidase domain-containing protein [Actinoplanes ferrugineus]GIE13734.1 multicopper oxidase [Actinoplanes ferrugineus]
MRKWFFRGLTAVLVLCVLGAGVVAWVLTRPPIDTVGRVAFDRALAVPPLARSEVDAAGRRVFELRAQSGRSDLGHGGQTATWGYNGTHLGPTLRARRGEQVRVNITNGLGEDTTVHWHGMHLPARMDGGPHQPIRPGSTFSPEWRIDQPASTLWYHPHPHERTEKQVYRGLAGLFLVDDPATDVAALPHEYGVDDVPVVVQDKAFTDDGQLAEASPLGSDIGILGDSLLVNGTPKPYLPVTTDLVRLRVLNASTARSYNFAFSDGRPFTLIGTDGGLLDRPHQVDRLPLSPAERAEVLVAMRPGEQVVLRSVPPAPEGDFGVRRFQGGRDKFDVLQLRAAASLKPGPAVPAKLVDTPRLDPAEAAQTRTMTFTGRQINDRLMEHGRNDAVVTKGTTEVWTVRNGHGTPHSFHIHDVQFQVLSRTDGGPLPPHLSGWKDTIRLPPQQGYTVIMRFADYADPETPYMFHCHLLRHEDQGMMGQFIVVEPGDGPKSRAPADRTGAGGSHHQDHPG